MQMTIDDVTTENKGRFNFKQYDISAINRHYLESFQQARYPDTTTNSKQRLSWNQYRCSLSNFLESLNKDVAMLKREDIDSFLSNVNNSTTKANKGNHIKAFMNYLITENVKNCQSKVNRDLLIKLLEM